MYKLFLCIRFLRSKVFAYFGMICVALSVCLMLIAVSVFSGFLDKIERAAKGLFGDIVVEPYGEWGLGQYDEFIAEVREKVPEVESAEPFILTLGVLRVEGDSNYRKLVHIAGIRLPGRADVSDFEVGLFVQGDRSRPGFDLPLGEAIKRIRQYQEEMKKIVLREFAGRYEKLTDQQKSFSDQSWAAMQHYLYSADMSADRKILLRRLTRSGAMREEALHHLLRALKQKDKLRALRAELDEARRRGATATEIEGLEETVEDFIDQAGVDEPAYRVILGLGIEGLCFRTDRGETVRYLVPGHRVVLSVAPLGKRLSGGGFQPNIRRFTVIDDSRSGVYSIDSKFVYVPFETLQALNNMSAEYSDDEQRSLVVPARCSQIHVKVRGRQLREADLRAVASKIREVWEDFGKRHPAAARGDVGIETWRQRQAQVVEPIQKQRTLVIIVIAIIWVVVVVLIFVIFYTIVTQKTREIGVLKAVGASGWGVAAIFLGYGAAVSLLGSVLGTVGGYFFVRNINAIQDWVDASFGYRVWSRDQFMFEFIPNEVDWSAMWYIFAGSIIAGLLGALLPAIRAARMQPVEALRYE